MTDDDEALTVDEPVGRLAHGSPRTMKLYDRTKERLTQDEWRGSGYDQDSWHFANIDRNREVTDVIRL